MKKLSVIAFIICLFAVSITSVSAMSESALKKKFADTLTLNGETYGLSKGVLVQVDRYLNQYDVSSKDANYIAERIDKAKKIIEKDGHPVFNDFSWSNKEELRKLVLQIAKNTSVKATTTKSSVIIYNSDGSVFAEVTELVKQTGAEVNKSAMFAGISLLIVVAGTCLIGKQVKSSK